jgi:hypothetical protein
MWQEFLLAYKASGGSDPWEFFQFLSIALDENKIPLPHALIPKSETDIDGEQT